MAKFFTDFSSDTPGAAPSEWTARYDAGTWSVEADGAARGGQLLRLTTAAFTLAGLSWDPVGSPVDVELLTRLRFTQGGQLSVMVRAAGDSASATHYAGAPRQSGIQGQPDTATSELQRRVAQSLAGRSVLKNLTDQVVDGDWHRLRVRAIGDLVQMRLWRDEDPEPDDWTLEAVDTSIADGGWVVLAGSQSSGSAEWDWVAVGTDGDSPELPEFQGAASLSGTGTLTASNARVRTSPVALAGGGTGAAWAAEYSRGYAMEFVEGSLLRRVIAALVGSGTVGAAGLRARAVAVTLTAAAGLNLLGRRVRRFVHQIFGEGLLLVDLRRRRYLRPTVAQLRGENTSARIQAPTFHPQTGNPVLSAVFVGGGDVYTIKRGDTLPTLTATLQEQNGEPIDLTLATVSMHVRRDGAPSAILVTPVTITDAPAGQVEFQFTPASMGPSFPNGTGDLDTGSYNVEFEITFGNGDILTVPNTVPGATIQVIEQLGSA